MVFTNNPVQTANVWHKEHFIVAGDLCIAHEAPTQLHAQTTFQVSNFWLVLCKKGG